MQAANKALSKLSAAPGAAGAAGIAAGIAAAVTSKPAQGFNFGSSPGFSLSGVHACVC